MFRSLTRLTDRLRGDAFDDRPVGGGFHLWWQGIEVSDPIVGCAVTLEVLREPTVAALYFWAMQTNFLDAAGTSHGAVHTGLQWNPRHRDSRAVNWGGYAQAADVTSILEGSLSELPSTPDDRNTRDYPWRAGAPYRFSIQRSPRGWTSSVTDVERSVTTVIRELFAGGDRLGGFVVWSELFCTGRDPHTAVRWSNPEVTRSTGVLDRPTGMTATYPGGREWRRLDTTVDEIGVVQATDVRRRIPHQSLLGLHAHRQVTIDDGPSEM